MVGSFSRHQSDRYLDDSVQELGDIQLGQWVNVAINYGKELPTHYEMHVQDCYVVAGLKRLGLIQNQAIPEVQRLKMSFFPYHTNALL